jgi:hypothetical protein
MDGRVLTLDEMETKHVFNSMKMCFNHLARHWGGVPVWFQKEYRDYHKKAMSDPKCLARLVVGFIIEIERRGDLPEQYQKPYADILQQVTGTRFLKEGKELLAAPTLPSPCS